MTSLQPEQDSVSTASLPCPNPASHRGAEPNFTEHLLDLLLQAHPPPSAASCHHDPSTAAAATAKLAALLSKTRTYVLITALNALLSPSSSQLTSQHTKQCFQPLHPTPPHLHPHIIALLSRIPYTHVRDGVRATLEFVFSVHPTSTVTRAEAATVQKRGAFITPEALALASRLIAVPAQGVDARRWFGIVAPQLWRMLDGEEDQDTGRNNSKRQRVNDEVEGNQAGNEEIKKSTTEEETSEGREMVNVAAWIITNGVLSSKEFGGLGKPGFDAFIHPLLSKLNPSLKSTCVDSATADDRFVTCQRPDTFMNAEFKHMEEKEEEEVVYVTNSTILVNADDLALALKRLHRLVYAPGHSALARRLLRPVVLSLWALSSWAGTTAMCERQFCAPARDLFKIFVRLYASADDIKGLVWSLLFNGNRRPGKTTWMFAESKSAADGKSVDAIYVTKIALAEGSNMMAFDSDTLVILQAKVTALVDIISEVSANEEIFDLFLSLFRSWLATSKAAKQEATKNSIMVRHENKSQEALVQLCETKVLQQLLQKEPQKLMGQPDQVLRLVKDVLDEHDYAISEDGLIGVAMSLLNATVMSEGFDKSRVDKTVMDALIVSLERMGETNSDLATMANNLAFLLTNWDHVQKATGDAPKHDPGQRALDDRKTYNLAIQYIQGIDAPPPIRSEGLNMLSRLIASRSPVLDIQALIVFLSSLMSESDEFVNLRVIKMFTQLANNHPTSVVQELLDRYVDASEQQDVDSRLRFGEALVQVVERLGETFAGDVSKKTCQTLLAIAGRRPRRAKTLQRQERSAKMAEMKQRKVAMAGVQFHQWSDDDDDEDSRNLTDEEKARNEILSQIVGGWESKRGNEDVRIRASALSILGASMEHNILGVGADMVTATVDVAMNVLTLEPEMEKGILRRSAVLAIMSFVVALDKAKKGSRHHTFDLTPESQQKISTTLRYIAQTDNDGLVRQHAKDVVESLANWRLAVLMPDPPQNATGLGIKTLAGLRVNPTREVGIKSASRPVIEEVE